ncbi:MAG: NADH-quinone oxidoreductase subunit N [Planctomycetes bacterium]|nr:NADH-quinone oxidoreductase subunit N [Planctomycetota bacterium]
MIGRLAFLWPEIALFAATCVVMVMGLSRSFSVRKASAWVCGIGLIVAAFLAATTTPGAPGAPAPDAAHGQLILPWMVPFAKSMICLVALLLLPLLAGTVDRAEEARIASSRAGFNPLRSNRAEFYSFFLFSITGLLLVASADNLIWLFLALELTSLPTYIMVAISSSRHRSQEAAVKYFFLGAMGAAIFLYGFALLYGAYGTTNMNAIAALMRGGTLSTLAMAGLMLSLLGLCFKIAAVPMHFYTADVYQGASAGVAAMLAFVPKTAGFLAILLMVGMVGWNYGPSGASLPDSLRLLLWVIAALTMTVGNVLAILQSSAKRTLAYSSIAHSGYMLVGVIAGPGDGSFTQNGISAVLFYLLAYGVTNVGTFAALACVERPSADGSEPRELDSFDDLRGLCRTHPAAGWMMVICSLSLLGLPPLLGFFGKLPLFTSGVAAGEIPLVIVLGLNSAIAAFYYLRLMAYPLLEEPGVRSGELVANPFLARRLAGILSAGGVISLAVFANAIMKQTTVAGKYPAAAVASTKAEPSLTAAEQR